jgi:hypothetical protein
MWVSDTQNVMISLILVIMFVFGFGQNICSVPYIFHEILFLQLQFDTYSFWQGPYFFFLLNVNSRSIVLTYILSAAFLKTQVCSDVAQTSLT